LANADKIKQELAQAQAKVQEILTQANAQANKAIEDARAAAAKVQESETQKAIAAAEQIIAKAREAAAADHARMLVELKREVGRLVVQTTATVTGKVLTPDDQKRLADETAKQLAR
jgi:F-type H+-transporting ATPase subunit b